MSSSDRSDGNGSGPRGPARTEDATPPKPIERSPRGRIVIRSSSHPPRGDMPPAADEASGARHLPTEEPAAEEPVEVRAKRDTPAERPRRRRQVRSAQLEERGRRDAAGGQRRRSPTSVAAPGAEGANARAGRDAASEAQPETLPGGNTRSSLPRALIWLVATAGAAALLWRLLSR
jgi:hypothetical protein